MSQHQLPEEAAGSSPSGADRLARWLVHRAARGAPGSLAERLGEEWSADLAARPSAASRLRFAIGCCWATRAIARELGAAVPVASAGIAGNVAAQPPAEFLSRRTGTFVLVVGVHVALFYGLITAVGTTVFPPKVISPIKMQYLNEPRKVPPVVAPRVELTDKWRIFVERPEFPSADPVDATVVASQSETPSDVPPLPPVIVAPQRMMGGPGAGFPDTEDFYPSASKRIGEQGVVQVEVCVRPDGRLSADPTLAQSSGHQRLDEGALRLAKAGSGHYRPSTENGHAVNSCYAYKIRFTMKD
jgi:periplasmic protein TonB